jgi:hypothetical protein
VELLYYYCDKTRGVCMVREAACEMTILIAADGEEKLAITDQTH